MHALLGPRFGIEATFILGVAIFAGLLELPLPAILGVIFAAWALVALAEIVASRHAAARPVAEAVAGGEALAAPPPPAPLSAPVPEEEVEPLAAPPPPAPLSVPVREEEAEPLPEPVAVEPEPEPLVSEPEPAAVEPEPFEHAPAAVPEPEPEPEPERPHLVAVPDPAPEPEPDVPQAEPELEAPEPEPEPAAAEVVPLLPAAPQAWNLWDLERRLQARGAAQSAADDELSFVLLYLREYASPDGALPVEFDALVRESFGDVIGAER